MSDSEPLLLAKGLSKRFPGVVALDGVDLQAGRGEIVAICGENGAGKSTLIKTLTGAHDPDTGTIRFDGKEYTRLTPRKAMEVGIACIYQELNQVTQLSVTENIFLGRELYRSAALGILDHRKMRDTVAGMMDELGLSINPDALIGSLGIGHQQMVEICRAVCANAKLIIMDEPTSSLSEKEAQDLFRIMAEVKSRGVSVLFISHRLDEVKNNCDSVTILRDGRSITHVQIADTSVADIIQLMVGREIQNKYPKEVIPHGEEALSIEGLNRKGVLHDVSFKLYAGEVLGFAGLVGAGRTETARAITGADPFDSGTIRVFGEKITIRQPLDSINAGIAFLTENRKEQGLILIQDVAFNSTIVNMEKYSTLGCLSIKKLRGLAHEVSTNLQLKTSGMDMLVGKLSGGNQQKVVIAKWLLSKARIFIFDEPTRGIDVGAKVEVYKLINALAARGAGVIIICSEMEEAMGMSDRILVMHEGRITAEFSRAEASQEKIMYAASNLDYRNNHAHVA